MDRLAIVVILGIAVAVLALRYRRGLAADAALGGANEGTCWPEVPAVHLAAGAPCTWLIFSTPWCASCEHVERILAEAFPHHAVRTIDATVELDLGDRYEVKRAPTTLLADHDGNVLERLVGPEAVHEFVYAADDDPAYI